MTDCDIDSLIQKLKRLKVYEWKDDNFEDLSVPWKEGNEQEFKSNFEKRLEQLKAKGKQLFISLSTIISKVAARVGRAPSETDSIKFKISSKTARGKKDSTNRHHRRHHKQQPAYQDIYSETSCTSLDMPQKQKGNEAKQAKTPPRNITTSTERGLASGTTTKSPEDLRVDGAKKETAERPRTGAANRTEENRLKEDIHNRLQEILGVIGKQDTTKPKSSGKAMKVDTTSKDLVADLNYVCSWIKDRKKEIEELKHLVYSSDVTESKKPKPAQPKTVLPKTGKPDKTATSEDSVSQLSEIRSWIEDKKIRWQEIETEIQLMKNLKEPNVSTTTQNLEKNANNHKTSDGKTSSNEVLSELTKVRSWITETIEESKSSMETIRKQILKLKDSVYQPDGIETKPLKNQNVSTKGSLQGETTSSDELLSYLKEIQSWIAKREKEIEELKHLVYSSDVTESKKPKPAKTKIVLPKTGKPDKTATSEYSVSQLSEIRSWIEDKKIRWQEIETEIQLMKNLKEPNVSTTTQNSEKNANNHKTNDGKTSSNEVLSELTKVRSWITETIEESKSSMVKIRKQILELKDSVDQPDGIETKPPKNQNVSTKGSLQGETTSCDELLSYLKEIQSWIAKRGSQIVKQKQMKQYETKKEDDNWRAVGEWLEHIRQTITTPSQNSFIFHKTSLPFGNVMMEIESDLKSKIQKLEQQYIEVTRDVHDCCEMFEITSNIADAKDHTNGTSTRQENKDPDAKKLRRHIDNYKMEYKRLEESKKALESNIKKKVEENQLLKEQVNSKSAEVDEITLKLHRQYEVLSHALDHIQTTCKGDIGEHLRETNKNPNANDSKDRNLEKMANNAFEIVTETIRQFKTKLEEANRDRENCEGALKGICTIYHNLLQADNTSTYGKEVNKNQPRHENTDLPQQAVQLVIKIADRQHDMKSENDNLRKEFGELQKNYEAAKSRLSKYMGADLRAGNPNIADLSDSNRPTKIAEAFSELYDNSWTNAFEELNKRKKVTEIDTIENLLDILKFANEHCTAAAKQQLPKLEYYMSSPVAPLLGKAKKELKKMEEVVDRVTLQALHDFRKKTWTVASANLIKHHEKIMKSEKKWKDEYSIKECSLYITTCIQLCWQMAIQDPPVHIEFEKKQKKLKFDKEKYRAYMRSGEEDENESATNGAVDDDVDLSSPDSSPKRITGVPFHPPYRVVVGDAVKNGEVLQFNIKVYKWDEDVEVSDISREYGDIEWLHHNIITQNNVDGIIIPPLPQRPEVDARSAEKQSKKQLGNDTRLVRPDEFTRDCRQIEKYLRLMLGHETFGNDRSLSQFLCEKEAPVRTKVNRGIFSRMSNAVEIARKGQHRDIDEFFSKKREWCSTYSKAIKDASNDFYKMVNAQRRLSASYAQMSSSLQSTCINRDESTVTINKHFVLDLCNVTVLLRRGDVRDGQFNQENLTLSDLLGLFQPSKPKLDRYLTKLSDATEDTKHGLEVLCNNDEKTLGFQLELYSRYIDSVKEMLFRRTCLLVDYEDANRALDKAKSTKRQAAEEAKHAAETVYEMCCDNARRELKLYLQSRMLSYQDGMTSFAESQIKTARDTYTLLAKTMTALKQMDS